MIKFVSRRIVFQEVPDEVSLAYSLSLCPGTCDGCHSPELRQDTGEELTNEVLEQDLAKFKDYITCVLFMGGDNNPKRIVELAGLVKCMGIKVAVYSGRRCPRELLSCRYLDYVKMGPYIKALGGISTFGSNQKMYKLSNFDLIDISHIMRKDGSKSDSGEGLPWSAFEI
jgi:anaerobic ribonucleoside-triphosphate reductase activating protein